MPSIAGLRRTVCGSVAAPQASSKRKVAAGVGKPLARSQSQHYSNRPSRAANLLLQRALNSNLLQGKRATQPSQATHQNQTTTASSNPNSNLWCAEFIHTACGSLATIASTTPPQEALSAASSATAFCDNAVRQRFRQQAVRQRAGVCTCDTGDLSTQAAMQLRCTPSP